MPQFRAVGGRLLTRLVGREAHARELVPIVDDARLVTLVGAPGCGKTRLSLEVSRRLADLLHTSNRLPAALPVFRHGLCVPRRRMADGG